MYVTNDNRNNSQYIKVKINKIRTDFVGKYETIDEIKERAIQFIKELKKWQCDQIAGTSLETNLPLTC